MRRLALLGLFGAIQLGAPSLLVHDLRAQGPGVADPRVGSWTLIFAQSSVSPPNKLIVTPVHDGVHVAMSGENNLDFNAKWDGHDGAVPGNPAFNQVELRRIDKKQCEVTQKKDGAVVSTLRNTVSSDGHEMTVKTAKPGHADEVAVWIRTGGPRVANDAFAGEWTQDLSKTRMLQGLTLKIEADSKNGVRFSGEFSYTARFDGKDYDLKNSRDDTVTLTLVDAHTVDSVYKRDGQPAEKDRWLVSGDGKQLTLNTMGTLESGQHVSERLVFQRQ